MILIIAGIETKILCHSSLPAIHSECLLDDFQWSRSLYVFLDNFIFSCRPVTKDELDAYRKPPASRNNDGNYATAGVSYRDNEDTYATAGRSPYDNDDLYTTAGTTFQDNEGATVEEEEQVVATTNVVVQQSPVVNDVMVHQAPEPEKDDDNMQTQELTVIFDENDHVVDVLTNTI